MPPASTPAPFLLRSPFRAGLPDSVGLWNVALRGLLGLVASGPATADAPPALRARLGLAATTGTALAGRRAVAAVPVPVAAPAGASAGADVSRFRFPAALVRRRIFFDGSHVGLSEH